ncbi:NUDIX hydrolase [Trueperella sp. LYQ143]|uniref:NUDIX hydrolase n=1 Tax=Trueperella sp. LYQ143 TaxID=3391059 RepID=UPI003983529B
MTNESPDSGIQLNHAPSGSLPHNPPAVAAPADDYEEEWPLDTDGFPHRQAARCVLFNPEGQIFLILGHDGDDVEHRWWFTPGGGLLDQEDHRSAACRELAEETGLVLDPQRLVGPVLDRRSTFEFTRITRKQDELFFICHITAAEQRIIDERANVNWTALEQEVLDDFRWWDVAELAVIARQGTLVYPVGLADMARHWSAGWDGILRYATEGSSTRATT